MASDSLAGSRVLDMACSCGYSSALLAERHPDKQVTGIDIDPEAIAYAQANYQRPNLRYLFRRLWSRAKQSLSDLPLQHGLSLPSDQDDLAPLRLRKSGLSREPSFR